MSENPLFCCNRLVSAAPLSLLGSPETGSISRRTGVSEHALLFPIILLAHEKFFCVLPQGHNLLNDFFHTHPLAPLYKDDIPGADKRLKHFPGGNRVCEGKHFLIRIARFFLRPLGLHLFTDEPSLRPYGQKNIGCGTHLLSDCPMGVLGIASYFEHISQNRNLPLAVKRFKK